MSNSCPFVISKWHIYCSNYCALYYIDDFVAIRAMYNRQLDLEIKLWEYTVAYAKQLATEEDTTTIITVRNQKMRDEIYRKIFPTKEQFEDFYFARIESARIAMEGTFAIYYANIHRVENAERIPVLGLFVRRFFRKMPPRGIFQAFSRDEAKYCKMTANRIYSNIQ